MASALKSLPVLVGAGTGAFVGKQFGNKPLIGAGVGLALGLFVLARLNQGPAAEAGARPPSGTTARASWVLSTAPRACGTGATRR